MTANSTLMYTLVRLRSPAQCCSPWPDQGQKARHYCMQTPRRQACKQLNGLIVQVQAGTVLCGSRDFADVTKGAHNVACNPACQRRTWTTLIVHEFYQLNHRQEEGCSLQPSGGGQGSKCQQLLLGAGGVCWHCHLLQEQLESWSLRGVQCTALLSPLRTSG
jgi:hypothetical protein